MLLYFLLSFCHTSPVYCIFSHISLHRAPLLEVCIWLPVQRLNSVTDKILTDMVTCSKNLTDMLTSSKNLSDTVTFSKNLTDMVTFSKNLTDMVTSSKNLTDMVTSGVLAEEGRRRTARPLRQSLCCCIGL